MRYWTIFRPGSWLVVARNRWTAYRWLRCHKCGSREDFRAGTGLCDTCIGPTRSFGPTPLIRR